VSDLSDLPSTYSTGLLRYSTIQVNHRAQQNFTTILRGQVMSAKIVICLGINSSIVSPEMDAFCLHLHWKSSPRKTVHVKMNPFETPQRQNLHPSFTYDITKQTFISIIQSIKFEKFSIAQRVATDDESDFIPFVSALLDEFRSLLVDISPQQCSPKRLLQQVPSELFNPPSPSPTRNVFSSKLVDEVVEPIDEVADVENDDGNNRRCDFPLIQDLITPAAALVKDGSDENISTSDSRINIYPSDFTLPQGNVRSLHSAS
jgi:hypothetical protein